MATVFYSYYSRVETFIKGREIQAHYYREQMKNNTLLVSYKALL
jgi:hypothetical protein